MRGVRVNLQDAMIHCDPSHRGAGQIIPMTRKSMYASVLSAQPTLMEPILKATIQVPNTHIGGVYQCVSVRRGCIVEEYHSPGSKLVTLTAYLPVESSFGFNSQLKQLTSGWAFPQCVFDHWEVISGDTYDLSSKLNQTIQKTRERKGMRASIPRIEEYLDRL